MNIDQVYTIVEESSQDTAFNRGEVEAMYDVLQKLPEGAVCVEIGVEYGRSTSVIAIVAKEKNFEFTAIDNWSGEYSATAREHILAKMRKYDWKFGIFDADSVAFAKDFVGEIDFIHIDGAHDYESVKADCEAWLPKVKNGGYICFDDYGHDSLPGVFNAVTEYISEAGVFRYIGRYGNKLGVFQKL